MNEAKHSALMIKILVYRLQAHCLKYAKIQVFTDPYSPV